MTSDESGVDVDRDEVVTLTKVRQPTVREIGTSVAIILAVGMPVTLLANDPLVGGLAGAVVLTVINEALWRYRGYPELAPTRRFRDAI